MLPLEKNRVIVCKHCFDSQNKINQNQKNIFLERIEIKHFDDLHIVFEFSELFQQLMYFYKYQGYRDIALYFAEALRKNIAPDYDLVTFVPLHSVKQRERGFNQSAFIAENLITVTLQVNSL